MSRFQRRPFSTQQFSSDDDEEDDENDPAGTQLSFRSTNSGPGIRGTKLGLHTISFSRKQQQKAVPAERKKPPLARAKPASSRKPVHHNNNSCSSSDDEAAGTTRTFAIEGNSSDEELQLVEKVNLPGRPPRPSASRKVVPKKAAAPQVRTSRKRGDSSPRTLGDHASTEEVMDADSDVEILSPVRHARKRRRPVLQDNDDDDDNSDSDQSLPAKSTKKPPPARPPQSPSSDSDMELLLSSHHLKSKKKERLSQESTESEMEVPYAQDLVDIPGNSQAVLAATLSDARKEPLRPGDVIFYFHPVFVAGSRQGRRLTQVLKTDPRAEFPLELANGEVLPADTCIRRVQEFRRGRLYEHPGIARPIENYLFQKRELTAAERKVLPQMKRHVDKVREMMDDLRNKASEIPQNLPDASDSDSRHSTATATTLRKDDKDDKGDSTDNSSTASRSTAARGTPSRRAQHSSSNAKPKATVRSSQKGTRRASVRGRAVVDSDDFDQNFDSDDDSSVEPTPSRLTTEGASIASSDFDDDLLATDAATTKRRVAKPFALDDSPSPKRSTTSGLKSRPFSLNKAGSDKNRFLSKRRPSRSPAPSKIPARPQSESRKPAAFKDTSSKRARMDSPASTDTETLLLAPSMRSSPNRKKQKKKSAAVDKRPVKSRAGGNVDLTYSTDDDDDNDSPPVAGRNQEAARKRQLAILNRGIFDQSPPKIPTGAVRTEPASLFRPSELDSDSFYDYGCIDSSDDENHVNGPILSHFGSNKKAIKKNKEDRSIGLSIASSSQSSNHSRQTPATGRRGRAVVGSSFSRQDMRLTLQKPPRSDSYFS